MTTDVTSALISAEEPAAGTRGGGGAKGGGGKAEAFAILARKGTRQERQKHAGSLGTTQATHVGGQFVSSR